MGEVFVAYGDSAQDTATLLLDAAEKAEAHVDVVRSGDGGFYVPEEIAKKAGVDYDDGQGDPQVAPSAPAKKAAPKAKTARKSTSKKAAKR